MQQQQVEFCSEYFACCCFGEVFCSQMQVCVVQASVVVGVVRDSGRGESDGDGCFSRRVGAK